MRSIQKIREDFLDANTATGQIGQYGWSYAGGATPVRPVSTTTTSGLVTIATTAVANNAIGLFLAPGIATGSFNISRVNGVTGRIRVSATTNIIARFGFGSDLSAANYGSDAVYWEFDSSSSANWIFKIRAGGSLIDSWDSGIAGSSSADVQLAFTRTGETAWRASIMQSNSKKTNTSASGGPSTVVLVPGFYCRTLTASSRNMTIDAFGMDYVSSGPDLFLI